MDWDYLIGLKRKVDTELNKNNLLDVKDALNEAKN